MLLLTLRGTPTLYYGDEIGMPEASIPPEQQQDPWGIRVPGLGRDGCRTPMQWDDQPQAGFSPVETSLPWLPINDNYRVNQCRNAAARQWLITEPLSPAAKPAQVITSAPGR